MGFRIDIRCEEKPDVCYYGTKLYGYVEDETKLASWKFLNEHDKFKELMCNSPVDDPKDIYWGGCTENITLTEKEFGLFIGCYTEDLVDEYGVRYALNFLKEVIPILTEPGYKLISWG